jgi:hypothetical protein
MITDGPRRPGPPPMEPAAALAYLRAAWKAARPGSEQRREIETHAAAVKVVQAGLLPGSGRA